MLSSGYLPIYLFVEKRRINFIFENAATHLQLAYCELSGDAAGSSSDRAFPIHFESPEYQEEELYTLKVKSENFSNGSKKSKVANLTINLLELIFRTRAPNRVIIYPGGFHAHRKNLIVSCFLFRNNRGGRNLHLQFNHFFESVGYLEQINGIFVDSKVIELMKTGVELKFEANSDEYFEDKRAHQ